MKLGGRCLGGSWEKLAVRSEGQLSLRYSRFQQKIVKETINFKVCHLHFLTLAANI